MRQIVLDLETQKGFSDVGGRGNLRDLGVSLVGTYHYESGEYRSYSEGDLDRLEPLLSECSRVIGFNIRRFDFPVLQPYFKKLKLDELPILDLLEEIEKERGHRVSLDSVARATLGEGKSGQGLDAIYFYRKGELDKLKKYCLDDVRLTKEIYEFGKSFKKVFFLSRDNTSRIEIPVSWGDPNPGANLSLF